MKKSIVLIALLASSCASKPVSEKVIYIDNPQADCIKVASLSSFGFSLIPPVASSVARSILESKAEEYKANSIKIDKETGVFQVEIEATGYRCTHKKMTKN